ncbi:MAG: PKD domain-containing protein, partial [Bacteroidota bacterium]
MHFLKRGQALAWIIFFCFVFSKVSAQTADFDFAISANGCDIATYDFTDRSTGANLNDLYYRWTFGNGNSVQETPNIDPSIQTPSASYNSSGEFTVILELLDGFNGTVLSTVSKTVVVYESASPDFSADVQSGCTDLTVNFSDLTDTSSPIVGEVVSWTWSFGDGNSVTGSDPVFSANPQHTYMFPGDYQVTLTVETFSGGIQRCSASEVKASFIRVRYSPEANFVLDNPPACDVPFTAVFRSTSTVPTTPPPAGNITMYDWTFFDTDGTTVLGVSTDEQPSFNYTVKGIYPVKLKVTTADGCSDSLTISNVVSIIDNMANFVLPSS